MSGVLAKILASKRLEVDALRGTRFESSFAPRAVNLRRDSSAPLRLIAEIKHRSPSAGPLSTALSPTDRALAYARAGASMVSVLCDGPFFDGAWEHVIEARRALEHLAVPILAKEFVIDAVQIARARAAGADAILLIVRIVDAATLRDLVVATRIAGLEPLVEVATEDELRVALDADAALIGVNARDLDTLEMDADRVARVLSAIPAGVTSVHLSGLKSAADVTAVARTRADAALLGEALMREDDPAPLLGELVAAAARR